MAFLGMAECNAKGDVNVSKFKDRIAGCGGFINITQNTHKPNSVVTHISIARNSDSVRLNFCVFIE